LGIATAQHLLESNAYVSILDLSPPPPGPFSSPDTLKRGDVERPRFIFVQTDITNVEQVEDAVNRTVAWSKETGAELGGVINSAGIGKSELVGRYHILPGGIHDYHVFVWLFR
jgi:NAD(P)-dependent dehydrogenase (short-subunit alcohol dehydrogenase family)